MIKLIEPRTLPGFRDFLPEQMQIRKKVIGIFTQVFEKYGFQPLETPTLEFQDILLGKYGEEAEKLMFLFKDGGGRDVGMRYDLTVPTARILAQYPDLPKPFKRYQIQPAWRAEKPQKGRYREFTQCDIDTFGTTSPLADAEIIAVIQECLSSIGFKKFIININSRQVLLKLMEDAGIEEAKQLSVLQSIDKLDKKSPDEVKEELNKKGISSEKIAKLFALIDKGTPDKNLQDVLSAIIKFGVPQECVRFNSYLVRGLDYYTGTIFETKVEEPKIGSVTGGGRYDKLIGQFTGRDIPAVGTTLGLDRICDIISELNFWPDIEQSTVRALITIFSPEFLNASFKIDDFFYQNNVPVEIYLDPSIKLDKQLKYADQKRIPFVIILGPEEIEKNLVTVKNLATKSQVTVTVKEAVKIVGSLGEQTFVVPQ